MREIASLLGQSESAVSAHLNPRAQKPAHHLGRDLYEQSIMITKCIIPHWTSLRFSDEAKSRMVDRLMAAAEQPEQPVTIHRVRRFPRIAAVGVAARSGAEHRCGCNRRIQVRERRICRRIRSDSRHRNHRPDWPPDRRKRYLERRDRHCGCDPVRWLQLPYLLHARKGGRFGVRLHEKPDTGLYDLYWKRSDSTIGRGVDGASGSSYFYDENPSDNAIQYVETMSYNDAVQTGGTVKITLGDLCVLNSENGEPTTIAKGAWRLKFQLDAGNSAKELPAGQTIEVNGLRRIC